MYNGTRDSAQMQVRRWYFVEEIIFLQSQIRSQPPHAFAQQCTAMAAHVVLRIFCIVDFHRTVNMFVNQSSLSSPVISMGLFPNFPMFAYLHQVMEAFSYK